jgi:hypothetical protein
MTPNRLKRDRHVDITLAVIFSAVTLTFIGLGLALVIRLWVVL